MRRACKYAVTLSFTGLLLAVADTRTACGEPQKKILVKAADIGEKVEIIGRIGKPMGTLMSIRGQWRTPSSTAKPRSLEFHVTHLDGKPLPKEVIFYGEAVTALNLRNQHGHEANGVIWEMRAFEDGRFVNFVERNWKEFYGAPVSTPDYGQGPFTCFLVGNVKRESRPAQVPLSKPE